MKKLLFALSVILLLNLGLVSAVTEQELNEAKNLIDSKVDCKSLSKSQLEIIGEYYVEQMHPGEAHKIMHKMMGLEEGSEVEEQFHINMAKTLYCGESGGMMGVQTPQANMMQGGMMQMMGNMMGGGMMSPLWTNNYGYSAWSPLYSIFSLVLLGLMIYFGYKAFQERSNNKWIWLLIGSVLLLILFGGTGMGGYGMMGAGMGFGFIFMLLFWGAVIWLIVTLINSAQSNKKDDADSFTILKKRYAKGEITKKEFESMKKEVR